jgi:diguanylate cyclase (GGDEF)-like protein
MNNIKTGASKAVMTSISFHPGAERGLRPATGALSGLYRCAVYVLLAILIVSGATLSWLTMRTARDIRADTVPLLHEKTVALEHVTQFETALLQQQLAMNKYFAGSTDRERFLASQLEAQKNMSDNFSFLRKSLPDGPVMNKLDESYHQVVALAFYFEKNTLFKGASQRAAKTALFEINRRISEISQELDHIKHEDESTLYQSEDDASVSILHIGNMVHPLSAGILLTGLFMLYHVWARFRSEDRLVFQANHDPLTGLPHRRSFERHLRRLAMTPHTVVLGRIDRFERVIGGLGHEMGDLMIQQITSRIEQVAARHGGRVFRLDGANIAILYRLVDGEPALQLALSDLRREMRRPFLLERHEIFSSLSLGAAEYPRHGGEPVQLMRNADAALRAARQAGGDCLVAYSNALSSSTNERLLMEASLGRAAECGELELYYQPQQHLDSGQLVGFEALLRWRHQGKLISPGDFIPLAEESGLIVELGNWVFAQACRQAKAWREQYGRALQVAVNISPRQFRHPEFLAQLRATLRDSQVDPGDIELEITEGMVMEESERMIGLLTDLRGLGLKLAIDDFGTGYSSLSYLTRFPVNRLKIDQSFIARLERSAADVSVVQAAIQLGHGLGLEVIGEGVETALQRECLHRLGCDEIQGYCYGAPMNSAAAAGFIRRQLMSELAPTI